METRNREFHKERWRLFIKYLQITLILITVNIQSMILRFLIFFYTTFWVLFEVTQGDIVAPSVPLTDVNYFGSRNASIDLEYFSFVAGVDITDSTFIASSPLVNYTLTKTLSHTYSRIQFIKATISSFNNSNTEFAFDIFPYWTVSPASSVHVNLTISGQTALY